MNSEHPNSINKFTSNIGYNFFSRIEKILYNVNYVEDPNELNRRGFGMNGRKIKPQIFHPRKMSMKIEKPKGIISIPSVPVSNLPTKNVTRNTRNIRINCNNKIIPHFSFKKNIEKEMIDDIKVSAWE